MRDEDIEEMFRRIGLGRTPTSVMREMGLCPTKFHRERMKNSELDSRYRAAIDIGTEMIASETIDIADEDDNFGRARNRIDTRKWYASKMNPRVYGDRIDLNVNQAIDLGSALTEARQRAIGGSTEPIDITPLSLDGATGSKPVDSEEATEIESIDIFS